MKLDEAINHCAEIYASCEKEECAEQHLQLIEWLQELKKLREENHRLKVKSGKLWAALHPICKGYQHLQAFYHKDADKYLNDALAKMRERAGLLCAGCDDDETYEDCHDFYVEWLEEHNQKIRKLLRCEKTGNLCGTDTVMADPATGYKRFCVCKTCFAAQTGAVVG